MILKKLEIRNYRSIRNQTETKDNPITFNGVDCLVGKNNAGKSNIIKAILYLFEKENIERDLYWNRDESLVIDVRGYFEITDSDFELLKIEEKREALKKLILDDGTLGICRRSTQKDKEVIGYQPKAKHLQKNNFSQVRLETWDNKENEADFETKMRDLFPELISYLTEGKESNKGEWTNAHKLFIEDKPEDQEFIILPCPPPQGISADLNNMLPRIISVPAVKEVSDATKTKKSELGSLLNELASEVKEELDVAILNAIGEVNRRLNIVNDATGEPIDKRHEGVRAIERQITTYVSETFSDISISLEFPPPESQFMFDNAKVWVNEKGFGRVLVANAGEGVKRVLIFSLFRTLADLRGGKISVAEKKEEQEPNSVPNRSLLILYEEAELFLHPGLQKILLRVFNTLFDSGAQIIFSTHSPFLIQDSLLQTIGLVRKTPTDGTFVTACHEILDAIGQKDKNTLTQIQNISSYIFSGKVVLVEGESDRIVIKKISKELNKEWDFDNKGIPVLPVLGKGNLPLFFHFMTSLGICPFAVLDIDCIESVVNKLYDSTDIEKARNNLIQKCHELAKGDVFKKRINKDYVEDIISSYSWNDIFIKLRELFTELSNNAKPKDEHLGALQKLIEKTEKDAWKEALSSNHEEISPLRLLVEELLLDHNILLLNGSLENYYPNSSGDKISSALEFDPSKYSKEEITCLFTELQKSKKKDLIIFFEKVFN